MKNQNIKQQLEKVFKKRVNPAWSSHKGLRHTAKSFMAHMDPKLIGSWSGDTPKIFRLHYGKLAKTKAAQELTHL